ncbi:MAG: carbamoyltransferase HypF, partial [Gemmataceae bacterium]
MADDSPIQAIQIAIHGLVQGVGFRPFIYRCCTDLLLRGWVENNNQGVQIHAEGSPHALSKLLTQIQENAPTGSIIQEIHTRPVAPLACPDFQVKPSVAGSGENTARFPPDRVTCKECYCDISDPLNRRYQYAFTTCVACGPRFSILRSLPYDRILTTMEPFLLCADCEKEYRDPANRRFHAEPIACPRCGPHVALEDLKGMDAIRRAAQLLSQGHILAMKGLGGYQLLARADSSPVIQELRRRKQRPTKPFAVMVRSLEAARLIGAIQEREATALQSARGPIVLVNKRQTASLVEEIAPGCGQVGLILPTTPLHVLLLTLCDFPLVATSGNKSDEPIAISTEEAEKDLNGIADHFLHHDRAIERRMDDSVVKVVAGQERVIRSARGFAPTPLDNLEKWIAREFARFDQGPEPIIALGAQQKNAQAIWTGTQAILGAHLGDLDHPKTMKAFHDHFLRFPNDYGCEVRHLACDLHPDYASTKYAQSTGLPVTLVQHHHAHAVASMLEHNLLEEEVLAFCWDGT